MADIDLIPESYRQQYQLKAWFKRYAVYFLAVSTGLAVIYIALAFNTANLREDLDELQLKNNIALNKKQQFQQLLGEKNHLQQELDLLNGLRSGISIEKIFIAIDRVFKNDSIWFTHWQYSRSESRLTNNDSLNDSSADSVYFMIVSDQKKNLQEKWQINTRLNINGGALNHAALSDFIRRLIEQPEINNVRIIRTEQFIQNRHKLIRFIIEVFINSAAVKNNE